MNRAPKMSRRTTGGLMLLIAVLALPLAWYVRRVGEFARERAAADEARAALQGRASRLLDAMDRRATIRAERPPSPPSISESLATLARLQAERARLDEKIARDRAEARARMRARLEGSKDAGSPPAVDPMEAPR